MLTKASLSRPPRTTQHRPSARRIWWFAMVLVGGISWLLPGAALAHDPTSSSTKDHKHTDLAKQALKDDPNDKVKFRKETFWSLSSGDKQRIKKANQLLMRWRADEAEKLLKPLLKRKNLPSRTVFVIAKMRYFQGKYKEAIKLYESAAPASYLRKMSIYASVKNTYKITKKYKQRISPHFIITYPPGASRVLVRYAVKALEKAYKRLGKIYGYYPPDRVRVEFLYEAMELADMSPLTQGDIMRTGTIALCKYNRLMITSPRALVRGYRWLDTLIHEYTHLVINRITTGIPIWLHEGLARYTEILWRSQTPSPLSPYSQSLLATAVKKDTLIAFARMHPSMAKLPSAKDSALAYAQVYTLVRYFAKRKGRNSLAKVLKLVYSGKTVPQAFETILGIPFKTFLEQWKTHLRNSKLKIYKGLMPTKKIIKGMRQQQKKKVRRKSLWHRPKSPQALGARYLRLAEMLRAKGRWKGALLEYLKAAKYWKNHHPRLQNKIALAHMVLRQYKKGLPHLLSSLTLYPDHVTTYVYLGRIYFMMKDYKKARKAFEEATQINPFHPQVHRYLSYVYQKLGLKKLAKLESEAFRIVSSE